MPKLRLLPLALLALAAGCSTATPPPSPAPAYYVMRHLQKAEGPDPALSGEGRAAAERLATWFGEAPPAAVYASATRRAQETAAPLAKRLGLAIKAYDPSDTPGLVARVKAEGACAGTRPRPVLVVGHSNTVPDILERLGGAKPAPLGETDFGDVWAVHCDGRTERRRLD